MTNDENKKYIGFNVFKYRRPNGGVLLEIWQDTGDNPNPKDPAKTWKRLEPKDNKADEQN